MTVSAAKHPANRDQLQRSPAVQQERPLNTHYHQPSHIQLMLGGHQNATTAQIDGQTLARDKRSGCGTAVANVQVQRVAKFDPALRLSGPEGFDDAVTLFSWKFDHSGGCHGGSRHPAKRTLPRHKSLGPAFFGGA